MEPDFLETLIEKEHYRAWLAKNITQEEEEQIANLNLQGIYLNREKARYYPEQETAAHVVGFVGKSMGLSGVEYCYNSLLNKYGSATHNQDAQVIEANVMDKGQGQYLVLTLDLKIQQILEKFILDLGQKSDVSRIAAILMETSTGGIVGAAHYPSYNPNKFHDYGTGELANILAEPVIIPETIKKLLWEASLLQSQFETGEQLPWCLLAGKRSLGSQLRLWDRLGLNDPLNVDFIRKDVHLADSARLPKKLTSASNYDSLMENATPLHLAKALSDLVMGESYAIPHVVDRIKVKNDKIYDLTPKAERSAVGSQVASEIRNMLKKQMAEGPLSSGYFETDAVSYIDTDAGRDYSHNKLFFSIIPQDKPKLMLFVFANLPPYSPSPSETKSRFSLAGSAKKITLPMVAMQEVMSNLSDMMSAEEKDEINFALHREVGRSKTAADSVQNQPIRTMPDVKGLSLRKSLRMLKNLKLEIQISGTGVVVAQSPHMGREVKNGEICRLVLQPN